MGAVLAGANATMYIFMLGILLLHDKGKYREVLCTLYLYI